MDMGHHCSSHGIEDSFVVVECVLDEQSVDLIKHKRMRADDFIMIKCIGRGAFGEVQLVSVFLFTA